MQRTSVSGPDNQHSHAFLLLRVAGFVKRMDLIKYRTPRTHPLASNGRYDKLLLRIVCIWSVQYFETISTAAWNMIEISKI